ncbi:MAG: hypothetical protein A2W74_10060 [Planctomycetes bacterium RIFCSPLOWO2_12_38_17]|nr:MAG: hypothetical protein A2W74_10060 [Planctomycetes bacterium RIFCSPLOWO2_12_38_17]
MCSIVSSNKEYKEVSLDDIRKIVKNLVKIGAGVVLLTGGEPFLREDLPEIVRIFTESGLNVRLQTAGLITKKEALKACVEAGAKDICVSLDSLDKEKQDFINGVKGSWEKAIQTIANISDVFPKRGKVCALGCVLSSYNLEEIPLIVKFATKIGWYVSLVPVHVNQQNNSYAFRSHDKSFAIEPNQHKSVDDLFEKLFTMKREGFNLFDSETYLKSSLYFIKNGTPLWRKKGICDSPNLYFVILPNGDFSICCDNRIEDKVSLIDDRFPEVYFDKIFRKSIYEIKSKCIGCQYGSYPEMSLMVRDLGTVVERVVMARKVEKNLTRSYSCEELLTIIDEIKKNG